MEITWNEVGKYIIMGVIALLGSPLTQWLKNQFKIQDRWALVLTGVVAALFAVGEMLLANVINWADFTIQNFPSVFFAVFSLATVYYGWLKNSPSFFGRGTLLKEN